MGNLNINLISNLNLNSHDFTVAKSLRWGFQLSVTSNFTIAFGLLCTLHIVITLGVYDTIFFPTFEAHKSIKFNFWLGTIPCKMGDWER